MSLWQILNSFWKEWINYEQNLKIKSNLNLVPDTPEVKVYEYELIRNKDQKESPLPLIATSLRSMKFKNNITEDVKFDYSLIKHFLSEYLIIYFALLIFFKTNIVLHIFKKRCFKYHKNLQYEIIISCQSKK